MTLSFSGNGSDSEGKKYSVNGSISEYGTSRSISLSVSEIVNPTPVEPAAPAKEEAEPGTVEAQEMPANGENV